MTKNIYVYIFITMLFTAQGAGAVETLFSEKFSESGKTTAVASNDSKKQQSIFSKCWDFFFNLSIVSGYSGSQNDSIYEPQFSKTGIFKPHNYVIGIHPLHNPKRLFEIYGPVVDFIDVSIPDATFKLEASRNYEEFERKLYSGYFDFAMPNPYQTINALKHGYRVFGKMAGDENFRGIILVRRDSGIQKVTDLKGKVVAYPARTALAATMLPQYYLHTHGININLDIENRYVGSQESSIMNVLRGYVAAGATWSVPWQIFSKEHPALAEQLEVKWQTQALPNNAWVVRKDVPRAVTANVAAVLFRLHQDGQGKMLLAKIPLSRFEVATDATYQPVRDFLKKFSATVYPVE